MYCRPVVAFALPDGSRRTLTLAEESADPAYSVDQSVSISVYRAFISTDQIYRQHGQPVDLAARHGHLGHGVCDRYAVCRARCYGPAHS